MAELQPWAQMKLVQIVERWRGQVDQDVLVQIVERWRGQVDQDVQQAVQQAVLLVDAQVHDHEDVVLGVVDVYVLPSNSSLQQLVQEHDGLLQVEVVQSGSIES